MLVQRAEQAACGSLDPLLLILCKAKAELICPSSSLAGVVLTKLNFVHKIPLLNPSLPKQGVAQSPQTLVSSCWHSHVGKCSSLHWER